MLKTKSVYSPIDRSGDGLRILATRFRGRRMSKNRYDVWMANLGPSERLLREHESWPEFKRRYKTEILAAGSVDRQNRTIKNHGQKFTLRLIKKLAKIGNVTLLCHCSEEETHCHRHVLQALINSRKI